MRKILFLISEDWFFVSHFLPMAQAAREAGFEVVVATRVNKHRQRIAAEQCRVIPLDIERGSLAAVDIQPVEVPTGGTDTRMAVQIRNDLIFNFTGGGAPYPPTHRLKIRLFGGRQIILVDRATAIPTVEA